LISQPEEDLKLICEDRLIVPIRINAWPGSGGDRVLKSKLNPETEEGESQENENLITDEATLSKFMNKLLQVINEKKK